MTHSEAFTKCKNAKKEYNVSSPKFHAYATVENNQIFCAETTENVLDWGFNFLVGSLSFPILNQIHWGFALTAKSLFSKIEEKLDKTKPVSAYGYSQGGAVAQILVWWLYRKGYQFSEVVTFGSARPYSWLFRLYLSLKETGLRINYVAKGDSVTILPPWMTRSGTTVKLGKWQPVWKSHQPWNYEALLKELDT